MDHADVAVLVKLMRTNLGAQLRRAASEADIPWVACTGHGRSSLLRAVEHTVAVVDQQRQGRAAKAQAQQSGASDAGRTRELGRGWAAGG